MQNQKGSNLASFLAMVTKDSTRAARLRDDDKAWEEAVSQANLSQEEKEALLSRDPQKVKSLLNVEVIGGIWKAR